ncbi:transcriptional regulator [Tianweitania sp. BSSL-BM11]|uniref:Transcriptional regulator n=1 Tax=Tianweitania aestuarii TaxID=2814886 RepID=A0ABS5RRB7_9HYPH|nr:transcriptional regulator [Tianweitania aestuarii]MBS9719524.1 transcriptional regulator [Tianweitania aestuarii]
MIVFLDFEASSLSKKSYPIEVAWVTESGEAFTSLLRPIRDWTDWSADAEQIHGLSRERLRDEGQPANEVAHLMVKALKGHDLYASAPSWDGKWLSVLLRAAGLPRHALRLRRSDDAFSEGIRRILGSQAAPGQVAQLVEEVIRDTEPAQPAHRALDDARLELHRWHKARERARMLAGSHTDDTVRDVR